MKAKETPEERDARALESLQRAQSGTSIANDLRVIEAFAELGIDATPRVDVFTLRAWNAKGRRVKRGEHGVKIPVCIPTQRKSENEQGEETTSPGTLLRSATVFHVSQTQEAK